LSKLWPDLTLQADVIGCGIIDKTMMCEAAVHSGMKPAIWVKYRLSFFHNNYSDKYCIAWMKNKAENPVSHWIIKKNNEKEKSNL
jgi:hypothetical protein